MSDQHRDTSIQLHVKLDAQNLPVEIKWEATDSPTKGQKECKAFMLSIWDTQLQQMLRIDLWDKEMKTDEMTHFIFQSLATMSDVLERSTQNKELANDMRQFARYFAQKGGITPPKK